MQNKISSTWWWVGLGKTKTNCGYAGKKITDGLIARWMPGDIGICLANDYVSNK